MNCNRCHADWPYDRTLVLEGQRLCELCWRVVIYPFKTTFQWRYSRRSKRLAREQHL